MGTLEDKIARLSPEEQHETEQFVDFLLMKNTAGKTALHAQHLFLAADPAGTGLPPCIIAPDPSYEPVHQAAELLPPREEIHVREVHRTREDQVLQERPHRKDPGLLLDWID